MPDLGLTLRRRSVEPDVHAGQALHDTRAAPQSSELVVAMKPLAAPSNRFPELISTQLRGERGLTVVPFEWAHLGQGVYDVVVFQWPDEFFMPESRRKSLGLLRRAYRDKVTRGTSFVWIVHNLAPHDGAGRTSRLTCSLFFRLLDGVIALSASSLAELHIRYPETRRIPSLCTAHGTYPSLAPPAPYRAKETRGRLLFFGALRAYKNPLGLVNAVQAIDDVPLSLTIAGHTWRGDGLAQQVAEAAAGDPRITLDLRSEPIPERELERMIDAHDGIVLPYTNILNSGVALHALSRNRPILAPNAGSLPELREQAGSAWVHLFDGAFGDNDLRRFLAVLPLIPAARPDLSHFSWERIGDDVARFLRAL